MKTDVITLRILTLILALSLAPHVAAQGNSHKQPDVVAVSGQSDWWILPPEIPSDYVTFLPDGGLTIQNMPLVGNFSLAGEGTTVTGVISGILDANLDPTLSGPITGPLVVTVSHNGIDHIAFEGEFFGRVNGLLASGQMILNGRGHYAGKTIALSLLETGPNTELFDLTGHLIDRKSR
jgi:hypothetical protein